MWTTRQGAKGSTWFPCIQKQVGDLGARRPGRPHCYLLCPGSCVPRSGQGHQGGPVTGSL